MHSYVEDGPRLASPASARVGPPKAERRPRILEGLPKGLRVLDVGCGSGVHGAELKRIHGHRLTGVDSSEESIEKAKGRLDEAFVADVTRAWEYPFAGGPGFDVILFSDILEHLYDPVAVLDAHLGLLNPGGYVLVSLPNFAIWNVRLELLFGRFRYRDTGTLDRTHIRFFNRRSFRELLAAAGLREERSRITPGILRPFVPLIKKVYGAKRAEQDHANSSSIMDSGPYRLYCRAIYPRERALCRLWPGLLAFQFVSLCRIDPGARPVRRTRAG
jgi:2-polyprenyl-3-methyl-5-hydroxy-6-metoxy-1,4-benzoquinol methylase